MVNNYFRKQFSFKQINPMTPKVCNQKKEKFGSGSYFVFDFSSKEIGNDESSLSFHYNKPLFCGNLKTFKSLNKSSTNENLFQTNNLKVMSHEIK